jgi:hypothetical protein
MRYLITGLAAALLASAGMTAPLTAQQVVTCTSSPRMAVEGRPSPYDSLAFTVGGQRALVCYGRPSLRGRQAIGGELVPYGQLWRTGANEPTILHLPVAADIAGLAVEPGSYALYTVPGEREWVVILNRSTSQWGHESMYTAEVQAQEVGRATVPAERLEEPVETFTIRYAPQDVEGDLVLEWDHARIRVPVRVR